MDINEELWKGVIQYGQKSGITEENLKAQADALLLDPEILKTPEAERRTRSLQILLARVAGIIIGRVPQDARKTSVLVVGKTTVQIVPRMKNFSGKEEDTNVASVFGLLSVNGGVYPTHINFWRDSSAVVQTIEPGFAYEPDLVFRNGLPADPKAIFAISAPNAPWPMKSRDPYNLVEVASQNFDPAPMADWENAIASEHVHRVRGSVVSSFTGDKDGRKFRNYTILTDEMVENLDLFVDSKGLTVWCDPDGPNYPAGSILIVVGAFSRGSRDQKPNIRAEAIIPVSIAPQVFIPADAPIFKDVRAAAPEPPTGTPTATKDEEFVK